MEYRQEIRAKLFPVVVFGGPIPDFGLAKSSLASSSGLRKLAKSDFSQVSSPVNHQEPASPLPPPLPLSLGEAETGGWLRKGKAGGNKFGETVYFVINDTLGYFCPIRNGELIVEDLAQFHKIVFCEMCCSQDQYYFRLNWVGQLGKQRVGDFFPANTRDRDLVVSWTCALQLRSRTFDSKLESDRDLAVKLALWLQSLYRGKVGRKLADRQRRKVLAQRGQLNALTRMMTGLLYEQSDSVDNAKSPDESSSSSSDEEDLDLVDPLPPQPVAKQRSTLLQFTKSLLPKRVALLDERVSRSFRRSSDASTPSSIATIVAEEEESRTDDDEEAEAADETVEDEIWENQRWQTIAFRGTTQVRGWSDVALLLTDRGAFSDRLGNVSFPQLAAIGVPPGGWQVTSPWRLASSQALTATSGSHKCNQDGWTYAPTFGSLDSNLASGNENTLPSPRWLVRRRRWVRVRTRRPLIPREPPLFAISGWLGMQGIMTGRWTNGYVFIPAKARQRSHPAICLFKDSVRLFDHTLEFRMNLTLISKRAAKVKHLDNLCRVSDSLASQDRPGLFSLHLSGEAEPRVFNAYNAPTRLLWVSILQQCIQDSPAPNYETLVNRRSMRKGAVWEFSRASGAVKGVVGEVKTQFKRAIVGGYDQSLCLHREDSDPDLNLIKQLREEHQREMTAGPTATGTPRSASFVSRDKPLVVDETLDLNKTPPTPNLKLKSFIPKKKLKSMAASAPMVVSTSLVEPLVLTPESPRPLDSNVAVNMTFEPPPSHENIMFDSFFDVSVDNLDLVLFQEEDFTRDILEFEKMFDVEIEPWTNGCLVGSESRRKYKMPRVGVVPPGPSLHLVTRMQTCPGQGYALDHVVSTPDVPFGTTFSVEFRYLMTAELGGRSRLIISQRVAIHKPSMAQSFIRSGTKREISNYYKNLWTPYVRKWLKDKRPSMIVGSTGADPSGASGKLEPTEAQGDMKQQPQVVETAPPKQPMLVWVLLVVCLLLLGHSVWLEIRLAALESRS